jgi:alanine racemase
LILKTHIEQIKTIKAGESIGYDFTFIAKRNMRIAILPIGYHDGVDRRLSNKGYVSYKAKILPIVGRISMNISAVDVTNANVAVGAMITIYSNDYLSENSIQNSARMCDTIPYELLIHLASSTKRVVI